MSSKDMKLDSDKDLEPEDMKQDMGACGGCEAGTVCDTSTNQCVQCQCLTNAECVSIASAAHLSASCVKHTQANA